MISQNQLQFYQGLIPFQLSGLEIQDFSPEWDYTTGGSKILICIKNTNSTIV